MFKDKPWHWCSSETGGKCGGIYRRHLPKTCNPNYYKDKAEKLSAQKPPSRELKVAKALLAVQGGQDSDDSD